MKCPKCQSDIKEGAKFCSKCGFNLQNTQPNPDVKQDVPESAVLPESRQGKNKKTGCIILILVLLIAGIGAGAWFVLQKSSTPHYQEVLAIADRYFNKLDYVMAEDYYLQSQQLDPKQKEPYIRLYEIYQITEEPDKAASIQNLAYENLEADDYSDAFEQMNQIDMNLALIADAENLEETEAEITESAAEDTIDTSMEETVEEESQDKDSASDLEQINARARKAYQNQMQSIYSTQKVGDYTLDYFSSNGSEVGEDQFMIVDITGDGIAELVFYHTGTVISASRCFIYSYDPNLGECIQTMAGSGLAELYDNGWLEFFPHQNLTGYGFVPISMDQYDSSAREYRAVFNAEGADPQSSSQDLNGNGEVVRITFSDGSADLYMDDSEFDAWFENYIGHGSRLNMDNMQYATLDNIQAIAD